MPDFLLHFVMRVMAPFMYSTVVALLRKVFQDPTAQLPSRMQQHPELYGPLRVRVDQHLRQQASGPQQGQPEQQQGGSASGRVLSGAGSLGHS